MAFNLVGKKRNVLPISDYFYIKEKIDNIDKQILILRNLKVDVLESYGISRTLLHYYDKRYRSYLEHDFTEKDLDYIDKMNYEPHNNDS